MGGETGGDRSPQRSTTSIVDNCVGTKLRRGVWSVFDEKVRIEQELRWMVYPRMTYRKVTNQAARLGIEQVKQTSLHRIRLSATLFDADISRSLGESLQRRNGVEVDFFGPLHLWF